MECVLNTYKHLQGTLNPDSYRDRKYLVGMSKINQKYPKNPLKWPKNQLKTVKNDQKLYQNCLS